MELDADSPTFTTRGRQSYKKLPNQYLTGKNISLNTTIKLIMLKYDQRINIVK